MRILVTGATGYVGSRLVAALLAAGHQVLAATREPSRLTQVGWFDDVTVVRLDAADFDSAHTALADAGPIDVVYYLVHAIGQPGFRKPTGRPPQMSPPLRKLPVCAGSFTSGALSLPKMGCPST